jgi:hypothetical protein
VTRQYHENLSGAAAKDAHGRYPALARTHAIFREDQFGKLQKLPLQQLWLDHLLALQHQAVDKAEWDEGLFVLLYPIGNTHCAAAAELYRACLRDTRTSSREPSTRLSRPSGCRQ